VVREIVQRVVVVHQRLLDRNEATPRIRLPCEEEQPGIPLTVRGPALVVVPGTTIDPRSGSVCTARQPDVRMRGYDELTGVDAHGQIDRGALGSTAQRRPVGGTAPDHRVTVAYALREPPVEFDPDVAYDEIASSVHPGTRPGLARTHDRLPQRAAELGVVGAVAMPHQVARRLAGMVGSRRGLVESASRPPHVRSITQSGCDRLHGTGQAHG